jgi:hypothetical protein
MQADEMQSNCGSLERFFLVLETDRERLPVVFTGVGVEMHIEL